MERTPGPRRELPSLGPRGEGWVAVQVGLFVVVVAAGVAGPRWPLGASRPLAFSGAVVALAGLAELLAGGVALGRSLTALPRPREDATFRAGLVYRFVRHPIYGGVLLLAAGWSLGWAPLGLAATALLAAFFELKSRREEAWLLERYPEYAAFRARVRWKFVPGLR